MSRITIAVAALVAIAGAALDAAARSITPGEQFALKKAACVFDAMTEAGKVFTQQSGAQKITPKAQEAAKREMAAFSATAQKGVRVCLTETEVYDLGRYSGLEDIALARCPVKRSAAHRGRTPNSNDGDLINGSTHWQEIGAGGLEAHPFFKGQADVRKQIDLRSTLEVCRAIIEHFGPTGITFPGLVVRKGL